MPQREGREERNEKERDLGWHTIVVDPDYCPTATYRYFGNIMRCKGDTLARVFLSTRGTEETRFLTVRGPQIKTPNSTRALRDEERRGAVWCEYDLMYELQIAAGVNDLTHAVTAPGV